MTRSVRLSGGAAAVLLALSACSSSSSDSGSATTPDSSAKADKLSAVERAAATARFAGPQGPGTGQEPLLASARTREGIDLLWRDIRNAFSA